MTTKKIVQQANKKELKAEEVHGLVSDALQAHFQVEMGNGKYEAQDMFDVLISACVERVSIEMASKILKEAPSGTWVRTRVKEMLSEIGEIAEVEANVNSLLSSCLPKKLLSRKMIAAIDVTELPYHGKYEEGDETVRRGKAKSGTTHFFAFATLYIVKKHKRYTLAVVLMRKSEKGQDVVARLLDRGKEIGLHIKRLYLDRGFDNNGMVAYLKEKPFPTLIPLTIRGKKGGTRALLVGRKSYTTTYQRKSKIYDEQALPVVVVCKYSKGRYKRHGLYRFAYIVIGNLKMRPAQIAEEYRCRFSIEASYRLMNQVRARTTCKQAVFRLLLVALAFFLLNMWQYVKWTYLFVPKSGPRLVLHHLLPLDLWRAWLWEIIKQRLQLILILRVPLSP